MGCISWSGRDHGLRIALGIFTPLCPRAQHHESRKPHVLPYTPPRNAPSGHVAAERGGDQDPPTRSSKKYERGSWQGSRGAKGRPRREGWLCASLINNYVFAHYISYIYKPRHIHIGDVSPLATRWTRSSPRPHRRPWTQRPRQVEALRPQQLKATRRTSCGPSLQPLSLSPCQLPQGGQPGSL